MSKKITQSDKERIMKSMYKSFSNEQVEHLDGITNIDARYKCAQRYMRELNEGKKGERLKAENAYKRFGEIINGLELIEDKRLTDETKIKHIIDLLDGFADKAVKLIEDNNRRHLERLKLERVQKQKEYEAQQARYDKEIAELEEKLR